MNQTLGVKVVSGPELENVQSVSKDFDVQWQSILSIWKELEDSSARPAPGPRPGFGASGPHVLVRRVCSVLTDCRAREQGFS